MSTEDTRLFSVVGLEKVEVRLGWVKGKQQWGAMESKNSMLSIGSIKVHLLNPTENKETGAQQGICSCLCSANRNSIDFFPTKSACVSEQKAHRARVHWAGMNIWL